MKLNIKMKISFLTTKTGKIHGKHVVLKLLVNTGIILLFLLIIITEIPLGFLMLLPNVIPIKSMYEQKIWPPCILVFTTNLPIALSFHRSYFHVFARKKGLDTISIMNRIFKDSRPRAGSATALCFF